MIKIAEMKRTVVRRIKPSFVHARTCMRCGQPIKQNRTNAHALTFPDDDEFT